MAEDDTAAVLPSWKDKIANALKFISLGSYSTMLYFKGSDAYTTVLGGIITILSIAVIIIFSIVVLHGIIAK